MFKPYQIFYNLLFLILIFSSYTTFSSVLYLQREGGAAQLALGGFGFSEDLGQIGYNPAYLATHLIGRTFGLSYSGVFGDFPGSFGEHHASFSFAWDSGVEKLGAFSFTFAYKTPGRLEEFNSLGSYISSFTSNEIFLSVSHFWNFSKQISFFEKIKFYYLDLAPGISTFFVVADIGLYVNLWEIWNIGFVINNIISSPYSFAGERLEISPIEPELTTSVDLWKKYLSLFYYFGFSYYYLDNNKISVTQGIALESNIYEKHLILKAGLNFQDGFYLDTFSLGISSHFNAYVLSLSFSLKPLSFADYQTAAAISVFIDKSGGVGFFTRPKDLIVSELGEEIILVQQGLGSYEKKDYAQAFTTFNKVLELNSQNKIAKRYKQRSLLYLETSEDWLDEDTKKELDLQRSYALKLEKEGKIGPAIREWTIYQGLDPLSEEAQRYLNKLKKKVLFKVKRKYAEANALFIQGDFEKALSKLAEMRTFNPQYTAGLELLNKIKSFIREDEEKRLNELEKKNTILVLTARALSYYKGLDWKNSKKFVNQALELDPENKRSLKILDDIKRQEEFNNQNRLGRDIAISHLNVAKEDYKKNRFYKAMEDSKRALYADPTFEEAEKFLEKSEKALKKQIDKIYTEVIINYKNKHFYQVLEKLNLIEKLDLEFEDPENYRERVFSDVNLAIDFNSKEGDKFLIKLDYSQAIFSFNEALKLGKFIKISKESKRLLKKVKIKLKKTELKVLEKLTPFLLKGKDLFSEEKWVESIEYFKKVLDINPIDSTAVEYIKNAKLRKQQSKEALELKVFTDRGKELLQNRDYTNALIYFQKVLEINQNNNEVIDLLKRTKKLQIEEDNEGKLISIFLEGIRFYKKREYKKSSRSWKKILSLDPTNELAQIYVKKTVEAQRLYKVADYLNCKELFEKGQLLLARDACTRAVSIDASRKVLQLFKDVTTSLVIEAEELAKQASSLFKGSKYNEALTLYRDAYRFSPDESYLNKEALLKNLISEKKIGDKLFKSGKKAISARHYLEVLELNPFDSEINKRVESILEEGKSRIKTWLKNAEKLEAKKQYSDAYSYYSLVLEVEPNNFEAKKQVILIETKLTDEAEKLYKSAYLKLKENKFSAARELANRSLSVLISYKPAKKLLAEINVEQRKFSLNKSSSKKDSQLQAVIREGILLYRKQDFAAAIKVWSRVPSSSSLYAIAKKYINRARLKE